MKSKIVKAIKDKNLKTVEQLQEEIAARTVCEIVIPDIEDLLDDS